MVRLTVEEVLGKENFKGIIVGIPSASIIADPKFHPEVEYPLTFILDQRLVCRTFIDPESDVQYNQYDNARIFMENAVKKEMEVRVYGELDNNDRLFNTNIIMFPDRKNINGWRYFGFNSRPKQRTII